MDFFEDLHKQGVASIRAKMAAKRAKPGPNEEPAAPVKAKRGHPERDIQRGVVAFVRRCCPGLMVAAIPNEEQARAMDPEARARFGEARKRSGVLHGHPDLIVYLPAGRVVLLEVKAKAGKLSETQRALHAGLWDLGHPVYVVRSIEEAEQALRKHGVEPIGSLRLSAPVGAL